MNYIKKNSIAKTLIVFYIIVFFNLFFINIGNTNISKISFFIIAIFVLFMPIENILVLIFALLPISRLFLINKNLFTLIPILEVIIVIKYIIGFKIKRETLKKLLFLSGLTFYSIFIEIYRFQTFLNSVKFFLMIYVMILMLDKLNKKERELSFFILIISTFICSVGAVLFPNVCSWTALYFNEYESRFQGLTTDPGTFGQYLICSTACLIYFLNKYVKKLKLLFLIVLNIIINIYFIIKSGTRACFIGLVFIYIVFLLKLLREKKLVGLFLSIFSIVIGPIVSIRFFSIILSSRSYSSVAGDTRWIIWEGYFRMLKENLGILIFGVGLDSCNSIGKIFNIGNPHNILIEKLTECGLILFPFFIIFLFLMLKTREMKIKDLSNLPFYSFLTTTLVYGSSGIEIFYFLMALISRKNRKTSFIRRRINEKERS